MLVSVLLGEWSCHGTEVMSTHKLTEATHSLELHTREQPKNTTSSYYHYRDDRIITRH